MVTTKNKKKHYLIVGNWKMYLSFYESVSLCSVYHERLDRMSKKQQLVILPPVVAISAVANILKETSVLWGAQDCSVREKGAYTGEISAKILEEIGCSFCLVGHSERRTYFHETNAIIAEKYNQLANTKVNPILCIGEQKKEKTITKTKEIVKNQLSFLAGKIDKKIYIAYEPGWAITHNKEHGPADPDFVHEMIAYIEESVSEFCDRKNLCLLYGASISAENIAEYRAIPGIDGFLIGASSTHVESLEAITAVL